MINGVFNLVWGNGEETDNIINSPASIEAGETLQISCREVENDWLFVDKEKASVETIVHTGQGNSQNIVENCPEKDEINTECSFEENSPDVDRNKFKENSPNVDKKETLSEDSSEENSSDVDKDEIHPEDSSEESSSDTFKDEIDVHEDGIQSEGNSEINSSDEDKDEIHSEDSSEENSSDKDEIHSKDSFEKNILDQEGVEINHGNSKNVDDSEDSSEENSSDTDDDAIHSEDSYEESSSDAEEDESHSEDSFEKNISEVVKVDKYHPDHSHKRVKIIVNRRIPVNTFHGTNLLKVEGTGLKTEEQERRTQTETPNRMKALREIYKKYFEDREDYSEQSPRFLSPASSDSEWSVIPPLCFSCPLDSQAREKQRCLNLECENSLIEHPDVFSKAAFEQQSPKFWSPASSDSECTSQCSCPLGCQTREHQMPLRNLYEGLLRSADYWGKSSYKMSVHKKLEKVVPMTLRKMESHEKQAMFFNPYKFASDSHSMANPPKYNNIQTNIQAQLKKAQPLAKANQEFIRKQLANVWLQNKAQMHGAKQHKRRDHLCKLPSGANNNRKC
ncbi:hypothetical protein GQR58_015675 [Nymphon striatum]|nr:hypothetical protein GQR58_015675 [Nymphon striatum]